MPHALVVVIVIGELTSMRRRDAADRKDRGSYLLFRGALALGYCLAFWLYGARLFPARLALGPWAVWTGALVNLSGTGLRVWAMRTLGGYFTRAVHVSTDQRVIETGPYRLLRHPSYTGAALAALGVGLAMANLAGVAILGGTFALGVSWRIHVEERALAETIGAPYLEYMKRTKRLIPYVF